MHFANKSHNDNNSITGLKTINLEPSLFFENSIWLNSADTANYLRKSLAAIHTAVHRGEIACRKWRRRLYFRKQDLDKMLEDSLK